MREIFPSNQRGMNKNPTNRIDYEKYKKNQKR